MRSIEAKPLTEVAFAPFGQLFNTEIAGPKLRQDYVADLVNKRIHARPNLLLASVEPIALPFDARELERHPASSQLFIPLSVSRYLVIVCPTLADGGQDLENVNAFIAKGSQGINFDPNVWHHGLTVLDSPGSFAVLFWEDGSDLDTEFREIKEVVKISI